MPKKDKTLNTREKITPVGIGMKGEIFEMFCPACKYKMIDLVFEEAGVDYPMKQCPVCLTIYMLGSNSQEGAKSPQEIYLAPVTKEWLKEKGEEYIRGAIIGSW